MAIHVAARVTTGTRSRGTSVAEPSARNRWFLLGLWLPAILLGGLLLLMAAAAWRSGGLRYLLMVLVFLGALAVALFGVRRGQASRFARLLKQPDPLPVVHFTKAQLSRLPQHGQYLAAANAAEILALYGRADEARHELESVAWIGTPPLIGAHRCSAVALIAYVSGDVAAGIESATTALDMAQVSPAVPGSARGVLAFRTLHNLGLALSGQEDEGAADDLQAARQRLPLLGRILATWALAAVAKRRGELAHLAACRDSLQESAPFFRPVFRSIDAGEHASNSA